MTQTKKPGQDNVSHQKKINAPLHNQEPQDTLKSRESRERSSNALANYLLNPTKLKEITMRYKQLMVPVLGRQTLWLLLAFFLTLGMGKNMAMAAAPVNDMFATAAPISEMTGTIAGTTVEATAEPGEPAHNPDDGMVLNNVTYYYPAHHSICINGQLQGLGLKSLFTPLEVHLTQSLPSTPAPL